MFDAYENYQIFNFGTKSLLGSIQSGVGKSLQLSSPTEYETNYELSTVYL